MANPHSVYRACMLPLVLGLACAAGCVGESTAGRQRERAAPSVPARPTEIGFGSGRQVFAAGPSTQTSLDGEAMRWTIDYQGGAPALATRELEAPLPATARRMRLSYRSDREGPILVRVEEDGGEAWVAVLEPAAGWKDAVIRFADLRPDPATRQDGRLMPEGVRRVILLDAGARERHASGRRSIWVARWVIE